MTLSDIAERPSEFSTETKISALKKLLEHIEDNQDYVLAELFIEEAAAYEHFDHFGTEGLKL